MRFHAINTSALKDISWIIKRKLARTPAKPIATIVVKK